MFNTASLVFFLVISLLAIATVVLAVRVRTLSAPARDADDRHRRSLAQAEQSGGIQRKIEAQLLDNQQRLGRLAHHDQLTGLPNRVHLAAFLPDALAKARKGDTALAILFLDLDRFKHINDTRGHESGDKLLQAVARRLREAVRDEDVVVRMGGDEFVVILGSVKSSAQVTETAARITSTLARPVEIDTRSLVTTVSIGVSMFPRDGETSEALLRHADTAMYQAKDRGRNNFQVFSPFMDKKLKERVSIEASLRAALDAGHLDVHYQPVVDVDMRRVVALEALVRWNHPQEGYISPAQFIPVAEETGLVVPLGEFVLRRVIADLAAWRDAGCALAPVAMNVSATQLRRYDLRKAIVNGTAACGLKPNLLQIELTEGAMFEQLDGRHGESNESAINDLRAIGVKIAIDDFGTGYSSLAYLKRWRVDYLKVDRSFIRDLATDLSDLAIVGAIIAMARHMRIEVIAEGVEGWPQLETLRKLGCRYAQGYLFAEPAAAAECARILHGRQLNFANIDTHEDLLALATSEVA